MYACKHVNTSYYQPAAIWLDPWYIQPRLAQRLWLILGHCGHSVAGPDYCKMENCTASFLLTDRSSALILARKVVCCFAIIRSICYAYNEVDAWFFQICIKHYIYLLALNSNSCEAHTEPISVCEVFYQALSLTVQLSLWGGVSLSEMAQTEKRDGDEGCLHRVREWRREGR